MTRHSIRRTADLLVIPFVAVALGCGEAPTEHEEEVEVHEMILSNAGVPVVTVEDGIVTGSVSVDAGDETPDFDISFIDHDGEEIRAGFAANAEVQNPSIAIFHSTADFSAHFEGISAGSTTVIVSLLHAADGDSHYDSPAIDLIVN